MGNGIAASEPDNFNSSQDALAIALDNWPVGNPFFGYASEWNDLDVSNNLYYLIEFSTTLPTELINFEGNNNGNSIDINWSTASLSDSDYFTLEHSNDGITFNEIYSVSTLENSTTEIDYYFKHTNAPIGINYYRLKQTDLNGEMTYSNTIIVKSKPILTSLYPNPTNGSSFISIESKKKDFVLLTITNNIGQTLLSKNVELKEGHNKLTINLSSYSKGVYFISVKNNNQFNKNWKLVKD